MTAPNEKAIVAEIAATLKEIFGDDTLGNELVRISNLTPEKRAQEHEAHRQEEAAERLEWLTGPLPPGIERYFFDPNKRFERTDLDDASLEASVRTHVHEWRTHIPDEVRERWAELSDETKQVAHYMAQEEADREEWD